MIDERRLLRESFERDNGFISQDELGAVNYLGKYNIFLEDEISSLKEQLKQKDNTINDLRKEVFDLTNDKKASEMLAKIEGKQIQDLQKERNKLQEDILEYIKNQIDYSSIIPKLKTANKQVLEALNKIKEMEISDVEKNRIGVKHHKSYFTALYCLANVKSIYEDLLKD